MRKRSIFKNNQAKNFKNLEILQSERYFSNFLQVINFDTFILANLNFLHIFYRKTKIQNILS